MRGNAIRFLNREIVHLWPRAVRWPGQFRWELLADATKVEPAATDYLGDIDDGFYASEYLRAWAFEAQLRAYLRERFGNAWFSRREAGSLLRELWAEGQKPTADELLREVTGEQLELAAVGDRVREALAAA